MNRTHLLPYLALCFLVYLFGGLFRPGLWYQTLNLAPWTPPDLAFPIVWAALYVLIAVAGWQLAKAKQSTLLSVWLLQLILNAVWSWIFFGEHWVLLALIDIVLILSLVVFLIAASFKRGLKSIAWLLAPYAVWLAYATTLNAYIVLNN